MELVTEFADAPLTEPTGVTPHIVVDGAARAIDFYKQVFAARETGRVAHPDGRRLVHAQLLINGGSLMLMDPFEESGRSDEAPGGYILHLQVAEGVDAWWDRAVAAGCTVLMPLETQFWGDRYGQVKDPFGVTWSIAQTQPQSADFAA